jgi:hypothetical protein
MLDTKMSVETESSIHVVFNDEGKTIETVLIDLFNLKLLSS